MHLSADGVASQANSAEAVVLSLSAVAVSSGTDAALRSTAAAVLPTAVAVLSAAVVGSPAKKNGRGAVSVGELHCAVTTEPATTTTVN